MYNDNKIIEKLEFIPPITDSMAPLDFFQKNQYEIKFTTYDMV